MRKKPSVIPEIKEEKKIADQDVVVEKKIKSFLEVELKLKKAERQEKIEATELKLKLALSLFFALSTIWYCSSEEMPWTQWKKTEQMLKSTGNGLKKNLQIDKKTIHIQLWDTWYHILGQNFPTITPDNLENIAVSLLKHKASSLKEWQQRILGLRWDGLLVDRKWWDPKKTTFVKFNWEILTIPTKDVYK